MLRKNNFNIQSAVVLTLTVCLFLLLTASCGQRQSSASKESTGDARITFLTGEEHDFGNYNTRDTLCFDFVFQNTGKVPFVIHRIEPSCFCTTADYSKRPVLPGATDTIRVKYDGNGFVPGYFVKRCDIYSNADTLYKIRIRGYFVEEQQ